MKTMLIIALSLAYATQAQAGPREDIVQGFMAQGASIANLDEGQKMYATTYASGKPDTPKCTTCHGATPQQSGQTRTGKAIAPMAVSSSPDRFTDQKKVDKWFMRNCKSVIGRECSAQEKLDFLTFLINQ